MNKHTIIKQNGFTIRSARTSSRFYVNLDGKRLASFYNKYDAISWCSNTTVEEQRQAMPA